LTDGGLLVLEPAEEFISPLMFRLIQVSNPELLKLGRRLDGARSATACFLHLIDLRRTSAIKAPF